MSKRVANRRGRASRNRCKGCEQRKADIKKKRQAFLSRLVTQGRAGAAL